VRISVAVTVADKDQVVNSYIWYGLWMYLCWQRERDELERGLFALWHAAESGQLHP